MRTRRLAGEQEHRLQVPRRYGLARKMPRGAPTPGNLAEGFRGGAGVSRSARRLHRYLGFGDAAFRNSHASLARQGRVSRRAAGLRYRLFCYEGVTPGSASWLLTVPSGLARANGSPPRADINRACQLESISLETHLGALRQAAVRWSGRRDPLQRRSDWFSTWGKAGQAASGAGPRGETSTRPVRRLVRIARPVRVPLCTAQGQRRLKPKFILGDAIPRGAGTNRDHLFLPLRRLPPYDCTRALDRLAMFHGHCGP